MGTSDKRLSLVFGWLRWITVEMSQWLSDMEHKWMSQTIEFSIRLYQNKNCETMDSFHQWLQVSKMESSKSCWNVLSYETDDGLLELVSCTENSLPQVANEEQTTIIITSWTKCEQPLDCPIGSLVDRKKANLLYRQTEDKKKEDTGNPSVKTTSCLSDDFIQRICQF